MFFYGSGSTYYRPVLMLSFLADLKLWNMHPGFMHLVNILLHVGNAILVYLNVRIFYPQRQDTIRLAPSSGRRSVLDSSHQHGIG